MKFSFRLLIENPVQRLGATGATEVSYLFPFKNGVLTDYGITFTQKATM